MSWGVEAASFRSEVEEKQEAEYEWREFGSTVGEARHSERAKWDDESDDSTELAVTVWPTNRCARITAPIGAAGTEFIPVLIVTGLDYYTE